MKILGAGLAGLIAGVLNQDAVILEPFDDKKTHQALLRFRSPDIGEAVGIPFKEVTVYKGIWDNGPVTLSPKYIAQYSRKISNAITYRSITNINTEQRWIAPSDFQGRLKNICKSRIKYNCDIKLQSILPDHIISTLPMDVLAKMLNLPNPLKQSEADVEKIKPIIVNRFLLEDCDVYMTIYFPKLNSSVYRASISGDTVIVESSTKPTIRDLEEVFESLGITGEDVKSILVNFKQHNGKMTHIDEATRKAFILKVTMEQRIYSLGRFAVWKNIVLDDVYRDILKIKHFINRDEYDHYRDY